MTLLFDYIILSPISKKVILYRIADFWYFLSYKRMILRYEKNEENICTFRFIVVPLQWFQGNQASDWIIESLTHRDENRHEIRHLNDAIFGYGTENHRDLAQVA